MYKLFGKYETGIRHSSVFVMKILVFLLILPYLPLSEKGQEGALYLCGVINFIGG